MRKGAGMAVYLWGGMILLFIFMIIFMVILSRLPSSEQAAKINTELLRSKINEACIKQGPVELGGLTFSQVIPSRIFYTDLLPAFRIKAKGDPDFLLYYEAFPVGEGLAWEVYQDGMGERIFAPFIYDPLDAKGKTINPVDFEKKLQEHHAKILDDILKKKPDLQEKKIVVLVPNIMLGDYVNFLPTEEPNPIIETSRQEHKKGNAGKWIIQTKTATSDNLYQIELTFNQAEKSFVKYRPCGPNSLCLKTPEVVYRIPLGKSCGDVSNIHLSFESKESWNQAAVILGGAATGVVIAKTGLVAGFLHVTRGALSWFGTLNQVLAITGVGAAGLQLERKVAAWMVGAFFSRKESDFYLASPCKFLKPVKIEKVKCSQIQCKHWIKYPIYNVVVDERNVKSVKVEGTHYQCIDGLGPSDNLDIKPKSGPPPENACINIVVEQEIPQFFCWTRNPFKEGLLGQMDVSIKEGSPEVKIDVDLLRFAKNDIAYKLGLNTVIDNTEYIKDNIIYVKEIPRPFTSSFLKEIFNVDWKWPGITSGLIP